MTLIRFVWTVSRFLANLNHWFPDVYIIHLIISTLPVPK